MSLSTFDKLFLRQYDRRNYNCLHFMVDVWKTLYGIDLSFMVPAMMQTGLTMNEVTDLEALKHFRRLSKPKTPCMVLMRSVIADETHAATYIDHRLLHITELGVQFLPLDVVTMGFSRVLYYEYLDDNK